MRYLLIILLCLMVVTAAGATQLEIRTQLCTYIWEPLPDITVQELAEGLPLLLQTRIKSVALHRIYEALSPGAKRHFKLLGCMQP